MKGLMLIFKSQKNQSEIWKFKRECFSIIFKHSVSKGYGAASSFVLHCGPIAQSNLLLVDTLVTGDVLCEEK